jgi:hypothetical protein
MSRSMMNRRSAIAFLLGVSPGESLTNRRPAGKPVG